MVVAGLEVSPVAIGAMTYGEPDRGHPVFRTSLPPTALSLIVSLRAVMSYSPARRR